MGQPLFGQWPGAGLLPSGQGPLHDHRINAAAAGLGVVSRASARLHIAASAVESLRGRVVGGHFQEGMVLGIHLLAQGILDFFGESLFNGNIYCCYLPLCFGELFVMVSIHWIQHPPLLQ